MVELGAPETLAAEIVAKIEALPDPKVSSGVTRSKFIEKFHLLGKMDWRRLETTGDDCCRGQQCDPRL